MSCWLRSGATSTIRGNRRPDASTANLDVKTSPFLPVYRTDDEWAAELSNRTVHAIMHIVWSDRRAPFRHWIVYPALMRQIERAWNV